MATRQRAAFLGGLLVVTLLTQAPVVGQARATEMELLQRTQQQPAEISNYLELVQIYMNARRFDEAEQMLSRALTVVRQTRMAGMPPVVSAPVRVGGDIKEPKKIKDVRPVYPDIARSAGVQGIVILEVIVTYDGTVREARVLRSVALLDEAAVEAVRQWQFTPTLLNNQPVEVVMTVTVNFTLG